MTIDNVLNASIVVYKPDAEKVDRAMDSVLNSPLVSKLYIVDNSPSETVRHLCSGEKTEYIFNGENRGFGPGHNIAIKQTIQQKIKYHLVLNPDVYFERGTLKKLCSFIDDNEDIALLMPKILYPDGLLQHLCKLLPTPMGLLQRRLLPPTLCHRKNLLYELRFSDYNKTMDVPYLSGCFMFLRSSILEQVGLFDERFFIYLEDTDLCRRINQLSRTVYFPHATIYHHYEKGSYKNIRLLKHHILSAIRYFNKWGYFFDKQRDEINSKTLERLGYNSDKTFICE